MNNPLPVRIQRRQFLAGSAVALAAASLPALPAPALLVRLIRYQSWPRGTPRPDEFMEGSIGSLTDFPFPLSKHMDLERHKAAWPDFEWWAFE